MGDVILQQPRQQLKFSFGSKRQRRFEVNRNKKKTGFLHKYSKILSNQEEEEPLIFEKTTNMAEENNGPTILVTGGGGYIGTHCIIELLQKDYNVVAIDNFTNSVKGENGMPKSLQKVSEMTGKSIRDGMGHRGGTGVRHSSCGDNVYRTRWRRVRSWSGRMRSQDGQGWSTPCWSQLPL